MATTGSSAALLVAGLAVLVMGYSVQRGATCTVAAIDELTNRRSASRLLAMLEASVWVAGGLLVLQRLLPSGEIAAGVGVTGWTVAGAALLGLGAYVNQACVFGAVARIGNGEWAYLATPTGFFAGCWLVLQVLVPAPAPRLEPGSVLFGAVDWLLWPLSAFCLWRLAVLGWRLRLRAEVWSPHVATLVIGITFLATWQLAGAWAYTDLLVELAQGHANKVLLRVVLALLLLVGAMAGGWSAGRWRRGGVSWHAVSRCLLGGMLMGSGSVLIPGSNDGLVLVGMPLLWPYAWVAFATMCLSIAAAQLLQHRLAR